VNEEIKNKFKMVKICIMTFSCLVFKNQWMWESFSTLYRNFPTFA